MFIAFNDIVCQCDAFVVIVLFDELRQNQGRGLVDRKLVKASSNFIGQYKQPGEGWAPSG